MSPTMKKYLKYYLVAGVAVAIWEVTKSSFEPKQFGTTVVLWPKRFLGGA